MENYTIPLPGTKAHEEFVRRAKDPSTVEGKMAAQMATQAAGAASQRLREMLHEMIRLVPGQLFRDIVAFHQKFGLAPTEDPGHKLPEDVLKFRGKFLLEELEEYLAACGIAVGVDERGQLELYGDGSNFDAEEAFDGLVDLAVVCLGTAYLHRFPFNDGWERVMSANMQKVRADSADDGRSHRGHALDIVKPAGWAAPVLADLLEEACARCGGQGQGDVPCPECSGTGRTRRKVSGRADDSQG